MNENTNSFGWRFKNSWFYLFSFVPFLQWIPFFISNGKIPKKRWIFMGFANILLIVAAFYLSIMSGSYRENHRPEQPGGRPEQPEDTRPQLEDFLGKDYWENKNYQDTPEYKEYEDALDAWYDSPEYKAYEKKYNEWLDSPEYKEYEDELDAVYTTARSLQTASNYTHGMNWLIFMILGFFVEKYKYLRELAKGTNRSNVYRQIENGLSQPVAGAMSDNRSIPKNRPMPNARQMAFINDAGQMPMNPAPGQVSHMNPAPGQVSHMNPAPGQVSHMNPAPGQVSHMNPAPGQVLNMNSAPSQMPLNPMMGGLMNVNTASEKELLSLPGVNTIDVKKIMEYRSRQGGFSSLDEFFYSFNAKPHVLVRVQKLITVNGSMAGAMAAGSGDMEITVNESADMPKQGSAIVNRRFDL